MKNYLKEKLTASEWVVVIFIILVMAALILISEITARRICLKPSAKVEVSAPLKPFSKKTI